METVYCRVFRGVIELYLSESEMMTVNSIRYAPMIEHFLIALFEEHMSEKLCVSNKRRPLYLCI